MHRQAEIRYVLISPFSEVEAIETKIINSITCNSTFIYGTPFSTGVVRAGPSRNQCGQRVTADLVTGRILIEKNIDSAQVPASLTKIMTLFIVFDDIAEGKLAWTMMYIFQKTRGLQKVQKCSCLWAVRLN